MCVLFLYTEQRDPGRFLMSGVLGRRRGPEDYVLFPNERREDEGVAIRRFFGEVSLGFNSCSGMMH